MLSIYFSLNTNLLDLFYKKYSSITINHPLYQQQIIDELENEEIPSHIREARMEQFKQMHKNLHEMKEKQHGEYSELLEEKQFLDLTISEDRCIAHFFHSDFRRCSIMDSHLKVLAKKHFESRFVKINVEKAKFFVAKLKIQILPTVLCFKKGVVVDRLIGFEGLGDTDSFSTETLENRLSQSGVIYGVAKENHSKNMFKIVGKDTRKNENESDDDDE